jgi:phosphate transport system protein
MDRPTQRRHTDREYESELDAVRNNLLKMTGVVEEMIKEAVLALLAGDPRQASETIARDRVVNQLELDTDELCLLILAKRQPLARDLRFVTLAMKMVTDLERIGDLAVNICERTMALDSFQPQSLAVLLERMAEIGSGMLRDVIDAFVREDTAAARAACDRDQEIDVLYLEVCQLAQDTIRDQPSYVERGIHLQAVAKFLERIGDHATNLAEQVIYWVEGKNLRHQGKLPR